MTPAQYIKELNRLKDQAVGRFQNIGTSERRIVDASFEWLVNNLDIQDGQIQATPELTDKMNEFVQAVMDIVNNEPALQSKLSGFLADLKKIQDNSTRFHTTYNNFNPRDAGVSAIQETVVNEIIDQYTLNGLNSNFASPLRDLFYRNILTGMNMQEAREVLRNYILGGNDQSGKLSQYLNQTAQQAVDSYTGAINQELVKEFEFTGFIISGSLIATSSKQCIYAVTNSEDGYMTMKEWEKVLAIARANTKAKLIEGTTLLNLPINKLHWGCRHDFTPVVKKEKKKEE